MLARAHRVTRSGDFTATVRQGRRAGSRTLVVHALPADESGDAQPRVGFVVGKSVGNAVVRNQVKRRLRHLARERLDALPGGTMLVVRALPASAGKPTAVLAGDLDRALAKAIDGGPR